MNKSKIIHIEQVQAHLEGSTEKYSGSNVINLKERVDILLRENLQEKLDKLKNVGEKFSTLPSEGWSEGILRQIGQMNPEENQINIDTKKPKLTLVK